MLNLQPNILIFTRMRLRSYNHHQATSGLYKILHLCTIYFVIAIVNSWAPVV